ncbi:MAG TPA: ethanolamine ammonia-lyase reactivating factor EutA [Chloroflexota bacterium]|nr:ethanolamine ammonia-lyase reactivating factor EutA [Chloroflexota bacterium]
MAETQRPGDLTHAHDGGQTHTHSAGHALDHEHDEWGFDLDLIDHHGDDAPLTDEQIAEINEAIWKLENVELTTVGVDVGSSTSHLMFARVHLQRMGDLLSSRFVVVNREVLWRSPILLTPYRPDNTIDSDQLDVFIRNAYQEAGLERSDVDSGAVILTGEALKRTNAHAIAELFATEAGKFVCASAGHHMEALLAANGSGTVALSREPRRTLLNVDIGGGTSKLAVVRGGEVLATAAVAVGGRLIAFAPDGTIERLEGPAEQAAEAAGVRLALGERLAPEDQAKLVRTMTDALVSLIRGEPNALAKELLVTDPLPEGWQADAITFSGGVAEYIYGRERAEYADIARALADEVRAALDDGRIPLPVLDPGQGIRATVIGASQFSVQVSGNTISISDSTVLPLRNLPVIFPRLDLADDPDAERVASEIGSAIRRFDLEEGDSPVALAFRWQGDPLYSRLRALADGIRRGMPNSVEQKLPLVLMLDGDVGKTLGDILKHELGVAGDVMSIDGMQLKEFDYVDIGEVIQPAYVVPVVIKSLLFAGSHDHHLADERVSS